MTLFKYVHSCGFEYFSRGSRNRTGGAHGVLIYKVADRSLAGSGKKQTNVSVRME